jgi:hypothetical protein
MIGPARGPLRLRSARPAHIEDAWRSVRWLGSRRRAGSCALARVLRARVVVWSPGVNHRGKLSATTRTEGVDGHARIVRSEPS